MARRKLTATTPHGTFTRTTARVYTHVVVALYSADGSEALAALYKDSPSLSAVYRDRAARIRAGEPQVSLRGWCGRPDLAEKLAAKDRGACQYATSIPLFSEVAVYPVDV